MNNDFTSLIEKFESPADLAVILLAGTVGFVVDAGLNLVGFLSPGYVGVTAASGALGIRKALQARSTRARKRPSSHVRAVRLTRWMSDNGHSDTGTAAKDLAQAISMYEQQIIGDQELERSITEAIKACHLDAAGGSGSPA